MCFAKSQKQVMHILEFVREQENFTMEQKITYKKNKPLTKQSHRASILSLLLCHIREVGKNGRGGQNTMCLSHTIIG